MLLLGLHGEIELEGVVPSHIKGLLMKLEMSGCTVKQGCNRIFLKASKRLYPANIITEPYPGFPTDLQSIIAATLLRAKGRSTITENIFENRFKYIKELRKMGAIINEYGNTIEIIGTDSIQGSELKAMDLRGGASLIVAALQAEGKSRISEIHYILRGYDRIDRKLRNLGANINIEEGE